MLFYQRVYAVHIIGCDTYAGSTAKMTFGIFVGIGEIVQFGDIFIGHQAYQLTLFVNHRQFLHFMSLECIHHGPVVRSADSDEVLAGHHLADSAAHVCLEAQVAVRDDTHQHMVLVHHGNTAYMIVVHHPQRIAYRLVAGDGQRVGYHAVLRTLDATHLSGLLGDGHVLVNDTDTSFTGNGNRHRRFGHGIHRGADHGDVQRDISGELSAQGYFTGQHFAVSGY